MSTRHSHYYANELHLFTELCSLDLCLDFPEDLKSIPKDNINGSYGAFTMPLDAWEEFPKDILEQVSILRPLQEKYK
jgi:hypothetical protein